MNWTGPFTIHCECGWEKTYRNPVAAQWGGEAHTPHCTFYLQSCAILRGEKEAPMSRSDFFGDRPDVDWIKPDDVKHGQVLTIDTFETFTFPGQPDPKPAIRFKELPDMALILNLTNYDFFADNFGSNEFDWGGEKVFVKIEQVENPRKHQALQPGLRFAKYTPAATTAATRKKSA